MSGKEDSEKDEQDCICYAKGHTRRVCPPVKNITHPLRYYEFTQEEIRVLEECDRESFYRRCMPFSTLFAGVTYAAIKYGLLQPNPVGFGIVPKMAGAIVLGHIFGRWTYIKTCAKKIRNEVPNSHIGKVMQNYHDIREKAKDPKKK